MCEKIRFAFLSTECSNFEYIVNFDVSLECRELESSVANPSLLVSNAVKGLPRELRCDDIR